MEIIKTYKEKVAIKPCVREERTKSGLIIPTTVKDKLIKAEVIALSKHLEDEGQIKIGDIVLVPEIAGAILEDDVRVINSYDIFCFIKE